MNQMICLSKKNVLQHSIKLIAPVMGKTVVVGQEGELKKWWVPFTK